MALTKPAGVAIQIVAAMTMLIGVLMALGGQMWIAGLITLAAGFWMLRKGGEPARRT